MKVAAPTPAAAKKRQARRSNLVLLTALVSALARVLDSLVCSSLALEVLKEVVESPSAELGSCPDASISCSSSVTAAVEVFDAEFIMFISAGMIAYRMNRTGGGWRWR